MKKLMIAAAIVCAAACANADPAYWYFNVNSPITGTDGSGLWSGTANITCDDLGFSKEVTVSDGNLTSGWLASGEDTYTMWDYSFTLAMTDGNYTYSQTVSGYADISFMTWRNEGRVTFAGGNAWTAAPEPTSGMLMLLGMAGLALKRERA